MTYPWTLIGVIVIPEHTHVQTRTENGKDLPCGHIALSSMSSRLASDVIDNLGW
jgi:hypothetical protein